MQYTIYLVNESAQTQQFWCFLAPPKELASDPNVFANSNTTLAVASESDAINTFTIPVQYVVGAGASNQAVGLNVKIETNNTKAADIGQVWEATYATVPPNMAPEIRRVTSDPSKETIDIGANAFDQGSNETNGWFSHMSFGIQTAQGFMGMTWSPAPQVVRSLTPKLAFYVATGSFGSNSLASWTDVSKGKAAVSVPYDFKYAECTVKLNRTGGWDVAPGKPIFLPRRARHISLGAGLDKLIESHRMLSESHAGLVAYAKPPALPEASAGQDGQDDQIASVTWDEALSVPGDGETVLTGTLTVTTALTAAFTYFVLAGVKFSITRAPFGGRTIKFSYKGTRGAKAIKDLFTIGASINLFS